MKRSTGLISAIKHMLNHPVLAILIPITFVFIIGYDIVYQFTIHPLNAVLNNRYFGTPVPKNYEFFSTVSQLAQNGVDGYFASEIEFEAPNVLDINFLKSLSLKLSNETLVIWPLSDWKFDLNKENTSNVVISTLNYNSNYLLNSFYLDNVEFSDFLITRATKLKIFILHKTSIEPLLKSLNYSSTTVSHDSFLIKELLKYHLLINDYKSGILSNVLTALTVIALVYSVFHLYLSITNLHKLRSNFGILIGWIIEVLLSSAAAIKIIEYTSEVKIWKQIFEPTTFFTTSTFILTVGMISSRNVIRAISDLAHRKDVYYDRDGELKPNEEAADDSLKRLYRFYIGINNNPDDKFEKLHMFRTILDKLGITLRLKVPNITKILMIDIFSMFVIEKFGRLIINFYFHGKFENYFELKIINFFKGIFLTLAIDHFLQLTFLVGIILIDNYRVDLTKILNHNNFNQSSEDYSNKLNFDDINLFSYWLLKTRPSRGSLRYKLGTNLTFMVHPTSLISWVIILPILQSVNILTVLSNWSVYTPYSLVNNSELLNPLNVLDSKFGVFYYLEFLTVLVFILSISSIVFRLSNFKVNKVFNNQVEIFDKRVFKSIDLQGHSLDIIKLKSGNSSFLISIGLDHKILVWSPLKISNPPNLSSTIKISNQDQEFWPINHINISSNGDFIVLVNNKQRIIRCFERESQQFKWTLHMDQINPSDDKILDSFFREKTLPGFLRMKLLKNRPRRTSDVSINGNYPRPLNSINEDPANLKSLEFIMVFESGTILSYSCADGSVKTTNILEKIYDIEDSDTETETDLNPSSFKLISAKKLVTPRVNDRIVCQVNNSDLLVAVVVNNKWNVLPIETTDTLYNQQTPIPSAMATPLSLSRSNSMNFSFEGVNNSKPKPMIKPTTDSKYEINKSLLVSLDFIGMVMRVNNMVAELIDAQTGIIMNKTTIGHFKPSSFRVSHSEPTHCRFCGCASIASISLAYEDFDTKTLMIHTLKIQNNRSKTNICLRVERDPREIRCVGFNNVIEEQYWFDNINSWEVTDINIIIGSRKEQAVEQVTDPEVQYNTSKLTSLKEKRKLTTKVKHLKWEGFIITLNDGDLKPYEIPGINDINLITNHNCIEKFGYKSVAISFGNIIKILYLGNDKLFEENLYFNDVNSPINNELMFLSKRRKK